MIIPTTPIDQCLLQDSSCSSAEIDKHDVNVHNNKTNQENDNDEASAAGAGVITRQQEKRRVVFSEDVVVRSIEHINDKSKEEVLATWYKKTDFRAMRSEFAVTLEKIARGSYKGDCESHCARGLEFRTPEGSQRRKMNKLLSLVAVLDEQERQRHENDENVEALACVYVNTNRQSRKESQKFGDLDAEEALRVFSGLNSLSVILQQGAVSNGDDDQCANKKSKNNGICRLGARMFKRKDSKQKRIRLRSPLRSPLR